MRTLNTDVCEAVDHLPEAAVLVREGVTWKQYEQVLEDLDERPGLRVTYDQGRLEIVTTSPVHEFCKKFIARMIYALGDELSLDVEGFGGATWKRKRYMKGTEPDTCFYVANAARIIGKPEIDLNVDPPPDIVVEVDKTNQSLHKFPIYAAFGVPEIWRYDVRRNRAGIYELREGAYAEIPSSSSFPTLTADALADFVGQSKTHGQTAALAAFRRWLKKARG
jgi:Uma2 family endonuclease